MENVLTLTKAEAAALIGHINSMDNWGEGVPSKFEDPPDEVIIPLLKRIEEFASC